MIKHLWIKGFRGIKAGEIKNFRQINLLVGANNSGKTAVMETLYLASTAKRRAVISNIDQQGGDAHIVGISKTDILGNHPFSDICARHHCAPLLPSLNQWDGRAVIRVNLDSSIAPLKTFLLASEHESEPFSKYDAQNLGLWVLKTPSTSSPDDQIAKQRLAQKIMGDDRDLEEAGRLIFCWHPDLTWYKQGSACWQVEGRLPTYAHTLFYDACALQQHLTADFCQRMFNHVPGWTQRISRRLNTIFNFDPSYQVQFLPVGERGRQMQGWIAPQDNIAIPIDSYGDGARMAFKLLAPLTAMAYLSTENEPGLLLWEEPELFQNPATLGRLLKEIADLIKDKPIQIFITTHSLEVVAQMTDLLKREVIASEDLRLFRLKLENGNLSSSWFDKSNLTTWLESGLDPRIWNEFVSPLQFRLREES